LLECSCTYYIAARSNLNYPEKGTGLDSECKKSAGAWNITSIARLSRDFHQGSQNNELQSLRLRYSRM